MSVTTERGFVGSFAVAKLFCRDFRSELNKNQLRSITGLTFRGLDGVNTLRLRQNYIEDLADGAFFGLEHLYEL